MSQLASWFVQLGTRGGPELNKQLDGAKQKLADGEKQAGKFAQTISTGFAAAATFVSGLAMAGLQGSSMADEMAIAWQELAREVSSILLPLFEMVVDVLRSITGWFRTLSGDGQNAVLGLGAAIATAVAIATGGLSAIIPAIVLVVTWIYNAFKATESGKGIMAALGGILSTIADIAVGVWTTLTEVFEGFGPTIMEFVIKPLQMALDALKSIKKALEDVGVISKKAKTDKAGGAGGSSRREVAGKGGQFEAIQATFNRIQQAAIKGKAEDTQKLQLEAQKESNKIQDEIKAAIKSLQPAFG